MLRAIARRLNAAGDVRHLVMRINAVETSLLELQRFKEAVERSHPEVAEQAKLMAREKLSREQEANAQGPMEALKHFEEMPLTPKEFEDLHQFYALHPVEDFPMSTLMHVEDEAALMKLTSMIQRQYLVRVARCAAELNNAPFGLSLMPSIQELRKWYEFSFHDSSTLPPVTNHDGLVQFTRLLKRIFVRHLNTTVLLSRGLGELADRDSWTQALVLDPSFHKTYEELEQAVSEFCDARIRLRFLVVHMLCVLSSFLGSTEAHEEVTAQDYFGHDPKTFTGIVCKETSLLRIVQHAVHAVVEEQPEMAERISVSLVGNDAATMVGVPSLIFEVATALVSAAAKQRRHGASTAVSSKNKVTVTVVQQDGSTEYSVLVSDQAGGMPLRQLSASQTYLVGVSSRDAAKDSQSFDVPYASAIARVFKGHIATTTIEAYGTDRVLYLPRQGFADLTI